MNIYVLDETPQLAARYHTDRHVSLMILESAQILSCAHVFLDGIATARGRVELVKTGQHEHRPCVDWARRTLPNYRWLVGLMGSLVDEYQVRFGKMHSFQHICEAFDNTPPLNISMTERTPFEQGVPAQYRRSNAVEAYREYYYNECAAHARWTVRGIPAWWSKRSREMLRA